MLSHSHFSPLSCPGDDRPLLRSWIAVLLGTLLAGCATQMPPPASAPPPVSAAGAVAMVAESQALETAPVERQLYVSPAGNDTLPCSHYSGPTVAAKTIARAVFCARAGEEVVLSVGEYTESVHVTHGGRQGKPLRIVAGGVVRLHSATPDTPALELSGSFVQVEGLFVQGAVVLGRRGGGSVGLVLSRMAVDGPVEFRAVGQPEKDPTKAATILQFSALAGPLTIQGHGAVVRWSTLAEVSASGSRHVLTRNTVSGDMRWQGSEGLVTENTFRGPVRVESGGDHTLFTHNTFTGPVWAREVIGAIFTQNTFAERLHQSATRAVVERKNLIGSRHHP